MADHDFLVRNGLIVNNFILYANVVNARVGVNNSNPDASFAVTGTANVSGAVRFGGIFTQAANAIFSGGLNTFAGNNSFDTGVLFIDALNNRVGVNNTTPDADFTLTGAANVSGNMRVAGLTTLVANVVLSGTLQSIAGNVNFDTNTVFIDATNKRFGIGVLAPDATLAVNGAANVVGAIRIGGNSALVGNVTCSGRLTGPGDTTPLDGFLIDCGTFA